MLKTTIYIGSDNSTHKISRKYRRKITQWADSTFRGYTILNGKGRYNGSGEDSIQIEVLSDHDELSRESVQTLKRELSQESIMITKHEVNCESI